MIIRLDGDAGPIELPVALLADHRFDGRHDELRLYYSGWPLSAAEAGVAVYVRGESGKLATARNYDDTEPPLPPAA